MLQQLLYILCTSLICCSWGLPPLLLLKRSLFADMVWYRSKAGFIAFLFLLGCMTLGLLSSWLYLFIPLRYPAMLALTGLQLSITVWTGRGRLRRLWSSLPASGPLKGLPLLFFILCIFLFLLLGCLPTANTDTRIYHLQIVEWASAYPAVPGVVNLFPRLGLGSNWLLLIGFFHIPGQQNFFYLNTSLVIWLFVWLFHQWYYHWRNGSHQQLSLFYFLLLAYSLFDWELFRNTASSTSYDPIVTTCLLLLLCCWVECILLDGKEPAPSLLFVFIALSALGFKLSGFFILILLAYHLFRHRRLPYYGIFAASAFLLIVTPVLVKNYIITGYPLFPLPLSIGSPDWKLPGGMLNLLNNYIVLSNRFLNSPFVNSVAFREQHAVWFAAWFKAMVPQHKLILLLSVVSFFLVFIKKKWPGGHAHIRIFMLLLLLMEIAWFFTAPSPRFSYATLLCTAFLPLSLFIGHLIPDAPYRIGTLAAICCILIYIPVKTNASFRATTLLRPQPFTNINDCPLSIDGAPYHHPEKPASGYICLLGSLPLPCTCQINPFLQPRGPSLSDGFRMSPAPDSVFVRQYKY
ncbi:MAG TPA: hypothetical protein VHD83_02510 [Puia sp.]|nr:hypothetical protein [Puia sp.]